jgi:hypothetical protein
MALSSFVLYSRGKCLKRRVDEQSNARVQFVIGILHIHPHTRPETTGEENRGVFAACSQARDENFLCLRSDAAIVAGTQRNK